jgi:tetratricopeptide (TPR) repeat protein
MFRLTHFLLIFLIITVLSVNLVLASTDKQGFWLALQEECQSELEEKPEDILINYQLSISMVNLGQIEEALEHFNHISSKISLEDFNECIDPYLELLRKNPDDILLLNYAAFSKIINLDYRGSINYFERIIELEPENVWIQNYLAATLVELEEYREADQVLCQAISIKDNRYSHLLLAIVNYKTGNLLKAITELCQSGDLVNRLLFNK